MKDLISFATLLCCIFIVYMTQNLFALIIVMILIILFTAKYTKISAKDYKYYRKYQNILKKMLGTQQKYFSDILAHDMRVPTLAQLRGLQLLKNGTVGNINQKQKEIISQVEYSCNYILDMIYMLISIHDIESNKKNITYKQFNITELFIKCFEELSENIQEKNITLVYSTIAKNTNVEADLSGIKSVIKNILNLAINNSINGSKISVNIDTSKNNLKVTVSGMYFNSRKDMTKALKYSAIGQNIIMEFTQKVIKYHNGKFYTNFDTNVNNSFIFEIPIHVRNSRENFPNFISKNVNNVKITLEKVRNNVNIFSKGCGSNFTKCKDLVKINQFS